MKRKHKNVPLINRKKEKNLNISYVFIISLFIFLLFKRFAEATISIWYHSERRGAYVLEERRLLEGGVNFIEGTQRAQGILEEIQH